MSNRSLVTRILTLVVMLTVPIFAWSGEGMVNVKSKHDYQTTVEIFTQTLNDKGFKIFNHVKHSQGAATVGIDLPNTQLLIFGNPAVGSKLMQCQQSVAIDLPMKGLIWQDGETVYLSYNDPIYLGKRHDMSACEGLLEKVSGALKGLSQSVQ
jgi:uncharacterized protein (DUF302 family)